MRYMFSRKSICLTASVSMILTLGACGGDGEVEQGPLVFPVLKAAAPCSSLQGSIISASAIGIPSGEAQVTSATLVAATAQTASKTPAGLNRTDVAIPEYCKVVGVIKPIDPTAPNINFQANLPTEWNQKAAQLGGSGLNGTIPAALNIHYNAPEGQPAGVGAPIARGYVEMGSDSGHQGGRLDPPTWTLNKEAVTNMAHAQMKKTRDVTIALTKLYYGSVPKLVYYMGSSQGGREALIVSQKYPNDYDAIFAQVPLAGYTSMTLNPTELAKVQTGAGWIPPAKVALIGNEVLRQCDALDGVADGVVNNYKKCNAIFADLPANSTSAWSKIRCASGTDEGNTCLSDAQIATLNQMHSFTSYKSLANGDTGFAGWPVGGEVRQLVGLSEAVWINEATQPNATYNGVFGGTWWRGVITGDINFAALNWDESKYSAQMLQSSQLADPSNPDISAFCNRGGKLIMKHHPGGDFTSNARELMRHYEKMSNVMGKQKTDSCTRLYIAPGLGHSLSHNVLQKGAYGDVIPHQIDMLQVLDDWATKKKVPADVLMQESRNLTAPFAVTATRPMCRYPAYPRYIGGDRSVGTNYVCSTD